MSKSLDVLCLFLIWSLFSAKANIIQVPESPVTVKTSVASSSSLAVQFSSPVSDGGGAITAYKGTRVNLCCAIDALCTGLMFFFVIVCSCVFSVMLN